MADASNGAKFVTPPYISYKTFGTLLGDFGDHGLPPVIDRSVLTRFSGGVAGQIMVALKSLGLMDNNNKPTPALTALVTAHGTGAYNSLVREMLEHTYPYVMSLDLGTATPSMFTDAFKNNLGAKEDVLRKCRTFFLHAAKDAGIEIGPRIANAKYPRSRNAAPRRKEKPPKPETEHVGGGGKDVDPERASTVVSQLLDKFPDFDPAWPDDIKAKWFEGFDAFMSGIKDKGG